MADTAPSNVFSVGKDIQVLLTGPSGVVSLPRLTGWHFDPQYDTAKSKPLDGPTIQYDLPDGYTGSLMFDRRDAAVDSLFASIEAAYHTLGGFVPTFGISVYVTERATASQSAWQFVEATLKYKPGSWKSGAPVAAQIDFYARYWRQVG